MEGNKVKYVVAEKEYIMAASVGECTGCLGRCVRVAIFCSLVNQDESENLCNEGELWRADKGDVEANEL